MSKEVYNEQDYPNLGKVTILEGKGIHFFAALKKCQGDNSQLIKYLMLEIVLINDKPLTEEQLNGMLLRDISYFNVVIGNMMSNDYVDGV